MFDRFFYYLDGKLYWKVARGKKRIGDRAGNGSIRGYRYVMLDGKNYLEHRVVWRIVNGAWPAGELDHINGVRDDNRIENLREATNQQNQFNRKSEKDSSSQYKGVSWYKLSKKWRAYYQHKGKLYHLGLYETEEEAAEAYRKATEHLHKEYANYG